MYMYDYPGSPNAKFNLIFYQMLSLTEKFPRCEDEPTNTRFHLTKFSIWNC